MFEDNETLQSWHHQQEVFEQKAANAEQNFESSKFYATDDFRAKVLIKVHDAVTVSNAVFKPMVRLASVTDDTFEPYCGGKASPSPDYPQDVHGISTSKIPTGSNLLKITATNETKNGVTFTVNNDGTITANGTASANITYYIAQKPSFKFYLYLDWERKYFP